MPFLVAIAALWLGGCSFLGTVPEATPTERETISTEIAQVRTSMEQQAAEPYWPFRLGELYTMTDSTELAINALRRSLEIAPDYAPAASLLSRYYFEAGVHNEAIALLEGVLAHNPDNADALRAALALHLDALGEIAQADSVLAGCSTDSKAAHEVGTYVMLRGEAGPEALDAATRVVVDNPGSAVNQNNYGIALLFAGRPVAARKAFLTALDIDKEFAAAMYNLAIVDAFYFFDTDAGRGWFAQYRHIASDDPDDLANTLGAKVSAD